MKLSLTPQLIRKGGLLVAGGIVLALALFPLVACQPENWAEDDVGAATNHVEAVDPIEGAYLKQGGTQVNFIFKRGDSRDEKDTFVGEIEVNGDMQRAEGVAKVGRDDLGTTLKLTADGMPRSARGDGGTHDAGLNDAGLPVDNRPIAQQAFNGTMHFLRIGKNDTMLIRGDTNGKTAHYKKVKTWCAMDSDCQPDVQRTGLECAAPVCTTRSSCACR